MTDAERPYVRAAVASVRAQTVPCRLLLYIDERNQWIGEEVDIEPIRVPLQAVGPIRNLGAQRADTELLAFLDADDRWHDRKIEKQLAFLDKTGADIVGCDYRLARPDGRIFAYGIARHIPLPSSWLVKRRLMLDCPFEPFEVAGDGEWWINPQNKAVKRRLPEFLVDYTVRGDSLSATTPSTRRKLLARRYGGPLLRAATWLAHLVYKDTEYRWYPGWPKRD